ncbi:MAG: Ycf66 family protein [Cyanobacteria bacterium P01_F01_bin.116]
MLANLLAVVVGVGSLGFYLAAFVLPEVHRRSDFFWSGVGMFYAVVLWYCARQMNGAVLLGQTASVGLLLWLGYQTLLLRRQTTHPAQQTPIRLGKSERKLNGSRPLIKDYEFVEDGVEDAVDQEPAPGSPILIQPAENVAPTMVVPAAIPNSQLEDDSVQEPIIEPKALPNAPTTTKTAPKRDTPNPIAAIGIFVGWLREIATPKKKAPQPMIELPSRPPSIPNSDPKPDPDKPTETASLVQNKMNNATKPEPAETIETGKPDISSPTSELETQSEPLYPSSSTSPQKEEEEESNWPDDNFWE